MSGLFGVLKDRIVISGGRVTKYQQWTAPKPRPWPALEIIRGEKSFVVSTDLERPGAIYKDEVDDVLKAYSSVNKRHRALFRLKNATPERIRGIGFHDADIHFAQQ